MREKKPRILVVDDEESIRRSLRTYLEDEGFEVVTAGSGERGLEILARGAADVAIVDIRLPGMDGNVFMERAQAVRPGIAFLICTGSVGYTPPEKVQALGIGDRDIFQKPLNDMALLAAAVRERVAARREK
jgi:two-component system, OmpR family, response regulator